MIELKDEEFQWIRTEGALASGMKVYFGASQDEQLPFVLTITPTYAAQKLQKAEERLLPSLPSAWSATGKKDRLADRGHLGLEALLQRLLPERREIGRQDDAGDDLAIGVLEGVDLRREIVGEVLIPSRVGEFIAQFLKWRPMNQGCHGAIVETQGCSSISHWVETGFVVSGVDATSTRSTLSWTMRSFATCAARFGFD
jgi:hypothetical protein